MCDVCGRIQQESQDLIKVSIYSIISYIIPTIANSK